MFPSVDVGQGDKKGAVMPRALFPTLFLGDSADTLELRGLTLLATKVPLRAGRTIFEEGERAGCAFGVSQGVMRLYKLLPDGRRHIVAFALPGDFLGMPLAERYGCSADAIGSLVVPVLARSTRKADQEQPQTHEPVARLYSP